MGDICEGAQTDKARRGRRTPPPCHSGSRRVGGAAPAGGAGQWARGTQPGPGPGISQQPLPWPPAAHVTKKSGVHSVLFSLTKSTLGKGRGAHTRHDACPGIMVPERRHRPTFGGWNASGAEAAAGRARSLREAGLGRAPVPAAFAEHTARWPSEYRGGLRTASNFGFL